MLPAGVFQYFMLFITSCRFPEVLTGGHKQELDRTETIQDDLNPVFEKKIMVDYFFEERQVRFHAMAMNAI